MDSSKIISLDDFTRHRNRYPSEDEALDFALKLGTLLNGTGEVFPLVSPRNIYIENDERWVTANPPMTKDASEAMFRAGAVLHYLLTRSPFRISYYLDGPPAVRDRNPQISVRLESIVSRLLENVRASRYGSIEELLEDLQRLQRELSGDWTVHWACFKGGNARTSYSPASDWNPEGGTLKEVWKASIGEIWASPVVAGENVFVGGANGNFYSIDAASGRIVWTLALGARLESSACIHGNTAYVGSDLGYLHAINIRNGSLLWKKSLGEYIRSSPCCDGTHVYVGSINPERKSGILWAVRRETGSVAWKKALGQIFCSPLVDQDEVFVGSDDENLCCFSQDGTLKWQTTLSGKIRSTAALLRDFLYVGGFGGVLYKIRRATGEIAWRNSEAGSMYSSPAVGKGIVASGNNAGAVQFFQIGTGKRKSSFSTGGPVTASPLLTQQHAVIGSNDGILYILNTQGAVACTFDAQSPINSSACLRNGRIYFGSDQGLHALSL